MLTGLRSASAQASAPKPSLKMSVRVDVIHLLQQIFIRRFPCLKRFFFSVRWEPL